MRTKKLKSIGIVVIWRKSIIGCVVSQRYTWAAQNKTTLFFPLVISQENTQKKYVLNINDNNAKLATIRYGSITCCWICCFPTKHIEKQTQKAKINTLSVNKPNTHTHKVTHTRAIIFLFFLTCEKSSLEMKLYHCHLPSNALIWFRNIGF